MRRLLNVAAALSASVGLAATAGATDSALTLPSYGFDMGGTMTAVIVALGALVGVAIGGWFAFRIVKVAIKWFGKVG